MTKPPRLRPERQLPPYSYVPGLAPHPTSDPRGHSYGKHEPAADVLSESSYGTNGTYLYAIDLFNHGFYWEAHEAWEALWHAAGRRGAAADFLKGLIKLAAAGVKLREGRVAGVRQHAARAEELFRSVAGSGERMFGLRVEELIEGAREVERGAKELIDMGGASAERQLPVTLRLDTAG